MTQSLILQPLLLHLHHSSFSNPSAALPMSQLVLQPFHCFTYIIGTSPTSPGELPMSLWWCLICSWWFRNLQRLRPAGLYEWCKLALELKRLKTPVLNEAYYIIITLQFCFLVSCWTLKHVVHQRGQCSQDRNTANSVKIVSQQINTFIYIIFYKTS